MSELRQRRPRVEDAGHLKFVRQLSCVICGDNTTVEAAHVSMADARADKRYVGGNEKADDCWTLPLCGQHHREQHHVGERRFWEFGTLDPVFICMAIKRVAPDVEAAERILKAWRPI